jgi:hypothetical protein
MRRNQLSEEAGNESLRTLMKGESTMAHRKLLDLRVAGFKLFIDVLALCSKRLLRDEQMWVSVERRQQCNVALCLFSRPTARAASGPCTSYLSVSERELGVPLSLSHIFLELCHLLLELGMLITKHKEGSQVRWASDRG